MKIPIVQRSIHKFIVELESFYKLYIINSFLCEVRAFQHSLKPKSSRKSSRTEPLDTIADHLLGTEPTLLALSGDSSLAASFPLPALQLMGLARL